MQSLKGVPIGPSLWLSAAIEFIVAIFLAVTPLFNLLGYEFSVAMSLLASVLAGPIGISTVRHARGERSWLSLWLTASLGAWSASIPAFLVISLNALRVQNCNFLQGMVLFLLLPLATSLICSGWAVAIGIVIRRRFWAGAVFGALWILVAATNLWEVWSGPQVLSYNQLAGWIAGPIYDEVIEPNLPLAMSRLMGLSTSLIMLILASWLGRTSALTIRRHKAWTLVMFSIGICVLVTLWVFSGQLGFGRQESRLERLLPKTISTEHFVIHHSAGLSHAAEKLLAVEHEFSFDQIRRQLGDCKLPPIQSWVFSDYSQKRKLLGAGRTQYTKPWQPAIYINGPSVPHPTLKHELVHAYASAFGAPPFDVSASHWIFINPGLTEGIAVAVDWPSGRFTPHTWSAALRRIGRAPSIADLFDPMGFWRASAGRSYTVAGSFVRYLLDTYGPEKLRRAYAAGTLDGFYPHDTSTLIKNWEKFLDGLQLPRAVVDMARLRFSKDSIFDRTCAHEIAGLRSEAARLFSNKNFEQARKITERILHYIPSDTSAMESLMEIDLQEHKTARAMTLAEQLISRNDLPSTGKIRLLSRMGDFMRRMGKLGKASDLQGQVLSAHLGDSSDRTAVVKLLAMQRHDHAGVVLDMLEKGQVSDLSLLDLRDLTIEEPQWAEAWYLLGRQLFNRRKYHRAIAYFWRAGELGLHHPSLAAENLRLLAASHYYQLFYENHPYDSDKVQRSDDEKSIASALAMFTVLAQFPRHEGELLMAQDWINRLCFLNHHKEFATFFQTELIRSPGRCTIHEQR